MENKLDLRTLTYPKHEHKTVKDVYGTYDVPIPEGYRVVDFRPVRKQGEFLISTLGDFKLSVVNWPVYQEDERFPVLIVEKIKPKVKVLRPVRNDFTYKAGEYYQEKNHGGPLSNHFIQSHNNWSDAYQGSTGTAYELVEEDFPS